MITPENGKEALVLIPGTLKFGDTGEKFCRVSKITLKNDTLGNNFIQLVLRGKDGSPVIGRLFGENVVKYADELEKYNNQIILVSYIVENVYDKLCLNVNWFVKPEDNDLKGISIDLFESIVPGVDNTVGELKVMFSEYPTVFTEIFKDFFNQNRFSSLLYTSDADVLNGRNGYVYVLLNLTWKRLIDYCDLGIFTKTEVGTMMLTQLLCETLLLGYPDTNFDYTYKVFSDITKVLSILNKCGTETERLNLKEVVIGYFNLRLDIKSKCEMRLSRVLADEFNRVYNTLKYCESLQSYKGVATVNGKYVK